MTFIVLFILHILFPRTLRLAKALIGLYWTCGLKKEGNILSLRKFLEGRDVICNLKLPCPPRERLNPTAARKWDKAIVSCHWWKVTVPVGNMAPLAVSQSSLLLGTISVSIVLAIQVSIKYPLGKTHVQIGHTVVVFLMIPRLRYCRIVEAMSTSFIFTSISNIS